MSETKQSDRPQMARLDAAVMRCAIPLPVRPEDQRRVDMFYRLYHDKLAAITHHIDSTLAALRAQGYVDELDGQREEVRARMTSEELAEWNHRNDVDGKIGTEDV